MGVLFCFFVFFVLRLGTAQTASRTGWWIFRVKARGCCSETNSQNGTEGWMYWRFHETSSPRCCFYPRISVFCWQRYIFTFPWSLLFTTLIYIYLFNFNSSSVDYNFSGSHLSPLPLSKLPSSCGYTLRSTQKDLVLVAPYDGCFVALEVGYAIVKAQTLKRSTIAHSKKCLAGFRKKATFSHCVGWGYQWRCPALWVRSLHLALRW